MDAGLMLVYVAGGAEGVHLCVASLCCISVLRLRNVLTFVCLDPSCQLITARQRGGSGDEETLLGRPGKPKHAARVTSACLTGTRLHRERFCQQMTWFSSTEEFSVPSKAVVGLLFT